MADQDNELEKLKRRLESLEFRLSRLEAGIVLPENKNANLSWSEAMPLPAGSKVYSEIQDDEGKGIESQIGSFGLAWLGNIVLLFGITFLTQYLMILGFRFISILIGYLAAGSIFYLANYLKKTNDHLSFMLKLNAQILLFFVTMRLHFFTSSPLITNEIISVLLLLVLVAFQVYISVQNRSQAFGSLSVLFLLTTAIISDSTHFMLPLVTFAAAGSTWYLYRFNWKPLLFATIFLTYLTFFLWLFGNPFMSHPMQILGKHNFGVIYLFALGACFSAVLLLRKKDGTSDDYLIGVTFANGILFTLLLLIVVLRFFSTDYVSLFAVITVCCLVYSTLLHSKSDWNFGAAYYALYGFMAMSIALYGLVGFPRVYLLLSVQSLLVVSMALWFRNRLIVVMNSILFLSILSIYLLSSASANGINFSFVLVSLVSARIINWKKSRLQIETDMMRNLYMIEGFIMMLIALSHAVPKHFVTLSWTMAALLYFVISILLKNIKYRYMALGTMICTAFYLFIVDLARIEIVYRVLALLFLAAISIGISMYYTNRIKKSDS
jgi:hypothetical protein